MTWKSSNLVYMVICFTCNEEYIEGTEEGKTKVQDSVCVYQKYTCQPQYQQLKCEEHFRTCGKVEFKIFRFFKVQSHNKYFREQYDKYFRDKFKPTLY